MQDVDNIVIEYIDKDHASIELSLENEKKLCFNIQKGDLSTFDFQDRAKLIHKKIQENKKLQQQIIIAFELQNTNKINISFKKSSSKDYNLNTHWDKKEKTINIDPKINPYIKSWADFISGKTENKEFYKHFIFELCNASNHLLDKSSIYNYPVRKLETSKNKTDIEIDDNDIFGSYMIKEPSEEQIMIHIAAKRFATSTEHCEAETRAIYSYIINDEYISIEEAMNNINKKDSFLQEAYVHKEGGKVTHTMNYYNGYIDKIKQQKNNTITYLKEYDNLIDALYKTKDTLESSDVISEQNINRVKAIINSKQFPIGEHTLKNANLIESLLPNDAKMTLDKARGNEHLKILKKLENIVNSTTKIKYN